MLQSKNVIMFTTLVTPFYESSMCLELGDMLSIHASGFVSSVWCVEALGTQGHDD